MRCQVAVLYFARSAELAGLRSETISVPRQITSLQLWEEIVKIHPSGVLITSISLNLVVKETPHLMVSRTLACHINISKRLAVIRDQVVFAVQQEYVLLGDQLLVLHPGDEIAIIPPISGG